MTGRRRDGPGLAQRRGRSRARRKVFDLRHVNGDEQVTWRSGDVVFDPSFNRGGDTLLVRAEADDFSAYSSGLSLVLIWDGGRGSAGLPIGVTGMTMEFAPTGELVDARGLTIDQATGALRIGGQLSPRRARRRRTS